MKITRYQSKKRYYILIVLYIIFTLSIIILSSGIFGVKMFTNRTNSMSPTITISSLIFVKKSSEYTIGDIISFYSRNVKQSEIITHRVYRIGGNVYMTKGDANLAFDNQLVTPRQIIGRVILIIPSIGFFFTFIKSPLGVLFCIILPATIIITKEIKQMILVILLNE